MGDTWDCTRIGDELATLAETMNDGAALHLASCDACRDRVHDARRVAEALHRSAGADHVAPDGDALAASVLARLDARAADARPVARPTVKKAVPASSPGRVGRLLFGVGALAAAASVAVAVTALRAPTETPSTVATLRSARLVPGIPTAWSATLGRVVGDGVTMRAPGGADFAALSEHGAVGPGATLRTDGRTRARLDLDDGTVLVLDRGTTVTLDALAPRTLRVEEGALVADVAHRDGAPPARLATPQGDVQVLGTKFALSAARDHTTVEVTRGVVRLGGATEVTTGHEGVLASGRVTVSPSVDLGRRVAWSELGAADDTGRGAGLGELRARRPGSATERDEALHLAEHTVRVRAVGNVARTEIEEVFRNDTGTELEGRYRFPLPSGAQVEELALDVDGRMEPGAFVERDRAAAIWRGVIRHASPVPPPPTHEEYVWVPGPWRDPALLEWQRGGRFELRVFPIPAHGARRVRIAYTETLSPAGDGVRRAVYPLPQDPAGSTRVDHFSMDVQVLGQDPAVPVQVRGYPFAAAPAPSGGARFIFAQDGFVPAGDVVLSYALAGADGPWTAWGYESPDDASGGFVALALRPRLARGDGEDHARDYVYVLDASRSMVGERWARATRLLGSMIQEMDRRDRVAVLACDVRCVPLHEGFVPATAELAREASAWLQAREPAGGSDLGAAVRAAAAVLRSSGAERDGRVVYLGDGIATVGHRRPASLAQEVSSALPAGRATFTAVSVGADADGTTLAAMARDGGGIVVPYAPGASRAETALAVLEATYGAVLCDPVVQLPMGLVSAAPAQLANVRAGGELLVTARTLPGQGDVRGDVVLRGTVRGAPFETRWAVHVQPTRDAGNAFVPRLHAAARIADLDVRDDAAARAESVALSRRFHLPSRHTSLLVLESPAMFRAFGVERSNTTPAWTGESEAQATAEPSDESDAPAADLAASTTRDDVSASMGTLSRSGSGYGSGGGLIAAHRAGAAEQAPMDRLGDEPHLDQRAAPARINAAPAAPVAPAATATPIARPDLGLRGRMGPWAGGHWMRRTWVRRAAVEPGEGDVWTLRSHVDAARRALAENADSRDRTRELFRWLSAVGDVDEAGALAERWLARDPLDADALQRVADVAARRGDRVRAMRWLGGVADVRPDDTALLERLAMLHDRAGDAETACAYRVSAAEAAPTDAPKVAAAVRCERALGRDAFAELFLGPIADGALSLRIEMLAASRAVEAAPAAHGELVVQAAWDRPVDLDVVLVDPQGARVSWQGGRAGTSASDALSRDREALGVARLGVGAWRIEVVRTDGSSTGAGALEDSVRGTVTVTALGERRVVPFVLNRGRVAVARVSVTREERLVPTSTPPPPDARLDLRRW